MHELDYSDTTCVDLENDIEDEITENCNIEELQLENLEDIDYEEQEVCQLEEYEDVVFQEEYTETECENEEFSDLSEELEIDYDEIYREVQEEALAQGFLDVDLEAEPERLDNILESFEEENWEIVSLEKQKESMQELYDYISDVVDLKEPPEIEFYNNERQGEYGGYNAESNVLRINEYMLNNAFEAADTVAHELWHAYQHECAKNPKNAREYQYQYNFENYITPELGQEEYETQLVEAEARAFAAQIKERALRK